ncbi:MAG: DUF1848 domain-containing protein [Planctomycetota bacterium]|jgi:hypothetical protein
MIVSASRRTDIPAFYGEWFMNRIRAGTVVYPNPFSGKPCRISLNPADVHSLVFWTKNFAPMLNHLPELSRRGFGWTALFTITGAPEWLEPCVPPWEETVETFRSMAELTSPQHVTWRFDPITLTDRTLRSFWLERFASIAERLHGHTDRCIVSFMHPYTRVRRRFVQLEREEGVTLIPLDREEQRALLQELLPLARGAGMALQVCCDDSLLGDGVEKAHCVDGERLNRLFPEKKLITKRSGSRPECGCTESRDIGVYGTCAHGCVYCYANHSPEQVRKNAARHDPTAESLIQ